MSESLRDLVVSLSLQTDNFTRNIKSVNKQIQEAESKFRLAAAGIEGFEKTATGLSTQLSTLERRLQLQRDAVTQYEKALTAAPGIGKKTAQRLVLELKDKVENEDLTSGGTSAPLKNVVGSGESEAIEALMALGYPASEAAKAVSVVSGQATKTDEILRLALKNMAGGMEKMPVPVYASTGAFVTRKNNRNYRLIGPVGEKMHADGFEFLMFDSWNDEIRDIRKYLKSTSLSFPVLHMDKSIGEILSAENHDKRQALSDQKRLLTLKKQRLERLIAAVDSAMRRFLRPYDFFLFLLYVFFFLFYL